MRDLSQTCFLVTGPTTSECAAWVQAWGSILAILAAVAIAFWQHHREVRRRQSETATRRAQQLEVGFQLCSGVQVVCQKVINYCSENNTLGSAFLRNPLGDLNAIRVMLGKFGLEEFAGWEELAPLVAVTAAADTMILQLERAVQVADMHDQTGTVRWAFKSVIDDITANVGRMREIAHRARVAAPPGA